MHDGACAADAADEEAVFHVVASVLLYKAFPTQKCVGGKRGQVCIRQQIGAGALTCLSRVVCYCRRWGHACLGKSVEQRWSRRGYWCLVVAKLSVLLEKVKYPCDANCTDASSSGLNSGAIVSFFFFFCRNRSNYGGLDLSIYIYIFVGTDQITVDLSMFFLLLLTEQVKLRWVCRCPFFFFFF